MGLGMQGMMLDIKPADLVTRLRQLADCDARSGEPLGKCMREAADIIDQQALVIRELVEALETAMDFIESNVADPDLTPEMWGHYRKLDHLEPRSLLARAAIDKAEK